MRWRGLILALLFACCAATANAVQPSEMLKDPQLEARARTLSRELRCMVCQNQSIDDSDAPLAHDLRVLVRERLAAGDSDAQVMDFVVARYGQFVLLKPRFERETLLLWLTPALVLVFGGIGAAVFLSRRNASARGEARDSARLTAEEEARLAKLSAVSRPANDPPPA
jgi:cytochrome c-type biogenesis protein CcmH